MPTAEILLNALPLDSPFPVEIDGLKIVIVRTGENVYAFHDVCPHALWPLSAGTFHDGVIECPGHAWEFDVRTRVCRDSPTYCLTSITTIVVGDFVRLEWHAEEFVGNKRAAGSLSQKPASSTRAAVASQSCD